MRSVLAFALALSILLGPVRTASAFEGETAEGGFPMKLFQQIAKERSKSNVLVSPLSISTALRMTYAGAEGETKKSMSDVLDLGGQDEAKIHQESKSVLDSLRQPGGNTKLEIANALFGEKRINFKEQFVDTNKKYYDAEIKALDFAAPNTVDTINSWVSEKTHDKITKIIDEIASNAILYLINAIYFKGVWEHKFEKDATKQADFHTAGGGTKKVQMMNMSRDDFRYFENNDLQAINLSYADKRLSMYVFLPKEGKSLDAFEAGLTQEKWGELLGSFSKRSGHIGLPRFKIEDKIELKDVLSQLGMAIAFDQSKADFSRMAEVLERLYISKVIHKTFMEVNEEGTEAAAVTAVEVSVTSARMDPDPPFRMIVDRPFFIALRDNKTGSTLFVGHIAEP